MDLPVPDIARLGSDTLRTIVENMPIAAVFIDGERVCLNRAAEELTGYGRYEIGSLDEWYRRIFPDGHTAVRSLYEADRAAGFPALRELVIRRKDGSTRTVEFAATGSGLTICIMHDISERKRMEISLRESEERYRLFSALTSDYVYSCSRHGNDPYRVKWLGGAIETITGYTAEEISAKGCWLKIVYPDDVARISEGLMRLAPTDTHVAEFRIVRKDGRVRWVHEVCRCLEGASPDELVLFGTSQDITLRRQQDRDIKILNENLERLVTERTLELGRINEELASFSYAVSHELRAPIARLIGFSNALSDEALSSGEARFLAERIRAASGHLQGVVDAILMLSRLSKVELALQPVDLSGVVRQKIACKLAEHPDRQVEQAIAPDVVAVADPALIEVCIENLVGNAIKYTGQTAGARIEFGVSDQHGQRVFFVRDNGAGFDMDFAEKLFVPFQRLHREDEFPGMGIGLATVERIIDRHHGRIWAKASVGGGAAFYFTLEDS
ncbi:MAG: PAS domain S-box protein [Geobacter sp.]|nr:PAS domain S-box protein [Geobacter sp.]